MPRTCAEIRAIVETSPYWADFVGDGASIPWEWFPFPLNGYLYAVKNELDRLDAPAFRLHDFLYDLRSDGLGITREEADLCLFADLLISAPLYAVPVYTACNGFGRLYFHRTWNDAFSNPHNMAITNFGGSMSTFKCTMLFEIATNRSGAADPAISRVAGWSESFFIRDVTSGEAKAFLVGPSPPGGPGLCGPRAALLPSTGTLVGQRIQEVGVRGGGQSLGRSFPGTPSISTDVPWMALLCKATPAGGGKSRTFTIGGIPDVYVTDGEFTPSATYRTKLDTYFRQVKNFASKSMADATSPTPILTIDGTGKVTTVVPFVVAVGDMVKITGATDAIRARRSGVYRVTNFLPLTNEIVVQGWQWGACNGGTIDIATTAYVNFGEAGTVVAERIKKRNVGRPFSAYRGRRGKRRARA